MREPPPVGRERGREEAPRPSHATSFSCGISTSGWWVSFMQGQGGGFQRPGSSSLSQRAMGGKREGKKRVSLQARWLQDLGRKQVG